MSNVNILVLEGLKEHFSKHKGKYIAGAALAAGAAGGGAALNHFADKEASKPAFQMPDYSKYAAKNHDDWKDEQKAKESYNSPSAHDRWKDVQKAKESYNSPSAHDNYKDSQKAK